MQKSDEPSNNSRRDFIKKIGSGIVTTYVATPSLKIDAKILKEEISNSISKKVDVNFTINGKSIKKKVLPNTTLAEFIRDEMNLTGTKVVCNQGECGSCTVLINSKPVYSCHLLALDANNTNILTIEGLLEGDELHSIQKAFISEDGLQCGFCTPGQIMTAYSIYLKNPNASDEELKERMSGNICRCGAYPKILQSLKSVLHKKI